MNIELTTNQLESIMKLPKFHGLIQLQKSGNDIYCDIKIGSITHNMYHYSHDLRLISVNKKFALGIKEIPGEIEFYNIKKGE